MSDFFDSLNPFAKAQKALGSNPAEKPREAQPQPPPPKPTLTDQEMAEIHRKTALRGDIYLPPDLQRKALLAQLGR